MARLQEKHSAFHDGYRSLALTSISEVARMYVGYPELLKIYRITFKCVGKYYTKADFKMRKIYVFVTFFIGTLLRVPKY